MNVHKCLYATSVIFSNAKFCSFLHNIIARHTHRKSVRKKKLKKLILKRNYVICHLKMYGRGFLVNNFICNKYFFVFYGNFKKKKTSCFCFAWTWFPSHVSPILSKANSHLFNSIIFNFTNHLCIWLRALLAKTQFRRCEYCCTLQLKKELAAQST